MFHCSVKPISRSVGRSATAAAAYRSASLIECQREGIIHDYTRKDGVEHSFIVGWSGDRASLWNAAEKAEVRRNARVAREVEISIPAEWSKTERRLSVEMLAKHLSETYGVAVDCSIHAPNKRGDQRNWHAHLMMTTREVEQGHSLGKKTRSLDDRKTGPEQVEAIRAKWSNICQLRVEEVSPAVWDHRSYERQGIDRIPTKHKGVSRTNAERNQRYIAESSRADEFPPETGPRTQGETDRLEEASRAFGDHYRIFEHIVQRSERRIREIRSGAKESTSPVQDAFRRAGIALKEAQKARERADKRHLARISRRSEPTLRAARRLYRDQHPFGERCYDRERVSAIERVFSKPSLQRRSRGFKAG